MAQKKSNKRKKKKKNNKLGPLCHSSQNQPSPTDGNSNSISCANFLHEAGPGCHIVRLQANFENENGTAEILGWDQDILEEDFDGQPIPDIALDPSEDGTSSTLTLCNVSNVTKVAYITVYEDGYGVKDNEDVQECEDVVSAINSRDRNRISCFGKNGAKFESGITTDNEGCTFHVVTFIVLVPPMTFCTLCEMIVSASPEKKIDAKFCDEDLDITAVRIESDVQEWKSHPNSDLEYKIPLKGFPLGLKSVSKSALSVSKEGGATDIQPVQPSLTTSFLCTQGVNGQLTHYFCGNFHAIDFRCDVGTPILAVEDGQVVEVKSGNTLSGICASNMFEWNSILIRHKMPYTIVDRDSGKDTDFGFDMDREIEENKNDFFTEYVHIQTATVKEGDQVQIGDIIGYSGSVGFSPEPHLHFAVYLSGESDAPSVGFWFQGRHRQNETNLETGTKVNNSLVSTYAYQPVAGKRYNAFGEID